MFHYHQFLWLFGFLILESQLILKTEASTPPELPDCDDELSTGSCTGTAADGDYYCIKNEIIYKVDNAGETCKGKIDSGLNVFEVTEDADVYTTTLVNLTGSTKPTVANLVIYSCSGTCNRTYGYVYVNNKYYSVGTTTNAEATPEESCTSDNIGKLFKDSKDENNVKLCLDENIYSQKINSNTASNYFMTNKQGNIFTGVSTDASNYIAIKTTQNAIILNNTVDGFFIAGTDQKFLSVAGEGTLYNCNGTQGVCTTTTLAKKDIGYYKNGDTTIPYIKCYETNTVDEIKCEAIANSNVESCSASNVGKLIKNGKLCLDSSKGKEFLAKGATAEKYLLKYSSSSIYSKNIVEDGKYGVISISENSMTIDVTDTSTSSICVAISDLKVTSGTCDASSQKEYKKCAGSVCYNECKGTTGVDCLAKSYYVFSDEGATLLTEDGEGKLYYCETPGNPCFPVTMNTGYFVNADFTNKDTIPYIECTSASNVITCNGIAAPSDSTTCDESSYGKLIHDAKLCLDGTNKIPFEADNTSKNYLVSYHSSSTFSDVVIENKYGVVKVNATAMILNANYQTDYGICVNGGEVTNSLNSSTATCTSPATKTCDYCQGGVCFNTCKVTTGTNCEDTTYYLVQDASSSIPVFDTTQAGKLYYCKTAGAACDVISDVGYYINSKDEAFVCEKGESFSCKIYSITESCTASTIGNPILVSDAIHFCLNYDGTKEENPDTKSEVMTGTLDINYLLNFKTENIFDITTGKKGLVSVKAKSVTLVNKTGYCLEDKSSSSILVTDDATEGILYECTNGICESVSENDTTLTVGYYKNIGAIIDPSDPDLNEPEYIAYTTNTVDDVTTKKYTSKKATSGDTCTAIGDILVNNNVFSLCLTTTDPITVILDPAGSKNGKYFIDVTGDGIVFKQKSDTGSHAIIVVNNENVYLSEKESGVEIYRYGESATQKLINFSNASERGNQCEAGALKNEPLEFSLIDEETGDTTNYYKLETTPPS